MSKLVFLDYQSILLNYYKELGLDENELATILVSELLIQNGERIIDSELLSIKMSLSISVIDAILVKLVEKDFLEYAEDAKGNLATTFRKLHKRLENKVGEYLSSASLVKDTENKQHSVFADLALILKRELTQIEHSRIIDWLSNGYTKEQIVLATNEATQKKGRTSITAIDKILLKKSKTKTNEIDDDLNEVSELLKTKWYKDN